MSLLFVNPVSGGKLYQSGAMEIPELINKNRKISLLVLAAQEYQPQSLRDNPHIASRFDELKKIYIPFDDGPNLSSTDFQKVTEVSKQVANHIDKGNDALVTCFAGINRSGLISALALKKLTNLPGKEILQLIRSQRHPYAVSNPLFEKIVLSVS